MDQTSNGINEKLSIGNKEQLKLEINEKIPITY